MVEKNQVGPESPEPAPELSKTSNEKKEIVTIRNKSLESLDKENESGKCKRWIILFLYFALNAEMAFQVGVGLFVSLLCGVNVFVLVGSTILTMLSHVKDEDR